MIRGQEISTIRNDVNEYESTMRMEIQDSRLPMGWGDLAYRQTGDQHGHTVVLVHAMSFDRLIWNDVILRIPDGYRLISLDLRGHGESDTPPLPYRLEGYAYDVVHLLEHLRVRACSLVGVSFGGMVAQMVASLRPDQVKRLVLSNTATRIGAFDDWMASAEEAKRNGFTRESTLSGMERLFTQQFLTSSQLVEPMVQRRMDRSIDGFIGCCQAIANANLAETTKRLIQPTLVIGSDEDLVTPPNIVEQLAKTIPDSSLAMISGAGHLPCVEAPAEFAECLFGFLQT